MKRIMFFALILVLLCGCGGRGQATEQSGGAPAEANAHEIWVSEETPVRVRYDRMWAYSASAESDDPALIAELIAAIRALEPGAPTDAVVEDYTDVLTFTFPDGNTCRLEFEEQSWVAEDHTRRHVEGLSRLRSIRDGMLEGEAPD